MKGNNLEIALTDDVNRFCSRFNVLAFLRSLNCVTFISRVHSPDCTIKFDNSERFFRQFFIYCHQALYTDIYIGHVNRTRWLFSIWFRLRYVIESCFYLGLILWNTIQRKYHYLCLKIIQVHLFHTLDFQMSSLNLTPTAFALFSASYWTRFDPIYLNIRHGKRVSSQWIRHLLESRVRKVRSLFSM